MRFNEKRKSPLVLIITAILLIAVAALAYLYLSPAFEQNKPVVNSPMSIHWNLKSKVIINIKDESGIKYYKISFNDGEKKFILNQKVLATVEKDINIVLNPPEIDIFYKGKNTFIEIEAVDNSKWNLLEGNKIIKNIEVKIDTKKPVANVLANSRYIQRGGSAVVVVKVNDENLKESYITFNNKNKFKLTPYYTKNHFAALIAWPIHEEQFDRVSLVAVDKAGNKTITKVPLYVQKKKIKIDKINLSKKFIDNISKKVLEQSLEIVPDATEEAFVYSNTVLRAKNIKTISDVVLNSMNNELLLDWKVKAFKRLRGSATVASYAERRHYYLDNKKINEAWHLGIDWASVRQAAIYTSNDGDVIFNGYLGLYGNSIIIDHGLGLGSLYAHTSAQDVEVGEFVNRNQKIANTGASGAVFGDHLHFGMLVQGVEVNPLEWMDKNWIKVRIDNILKNAKKQIDKKL